MEGQNGAVDAWNRARIISLFPEPADFYFGFNHLEFPVTCYEFAFMLLCKRHCKCVGIGQPSARLESRCDPREVPIRIHNLYPNLAQVGNCGIGFPFRPLTGEDIPNLASVNDAYQHVSPTFGNIRYQIGDVFGGRLVLQKRNYRP